MKIGKKETLAYVAGLLDADGCIRIDKQKPDPKYRRKSWHYFLNVAITNDDEDLVNWLRKNFGGSITTARKRPAPQRPTWDWRIMSNQAKDLLKALYPYMRIKKEQARLAIKFQESKNPHNNKSPSNAVQQKREWYKQEVSRLKHI